MRYSIHSSSKSILIKTVSFLLIFLFIYAAISKLIDYERFKIQLGQSPILNTYANLIAWTIPLIEIIASVLLVFNSTRIIGLYLSFSLMTMFSIYIYTITHFSEYVPCSCGGILEHMSWNQHLVFNLFFVILSLVSIFLSPFSLIVKTSPKNSYA